MRLPGTGSSYERVNTEESDIAEPTRSEVNPGDQNVLPPPDPPGYTPPSEQMELEDIETHGSRISRLKQTFTEVVYSPVRERIVDPLAGLIYFVSDQADYQLSKIGNPLILRRFFYVIFVSLATLFIMKSGYLPKNNTINGSNGMFAKHDEMLGYAFESVDLSKFERDLEYLSRMSHMSGTKGDMAIKRYIQDSFHNNGLKVARDSAYMAYSNYPSDSNTLTVYHNGERHSLDLTHYNFNPMSSNGSVQGASLIYGNAGSWDDWRRLEDAGIIKEDFVVLLNYSEVPSEQILRATKYNAKAVIFISEPYGEDEEVVQMKPVGLYQYYTGDTLTPGSYGDSRYAESDDWIKNVPKIPSLPISSKMAKQLLSLLSGGIEYDGIFYSSGHLGDIKVDLEIDNYIRERHPVVNIIGKVEGKEQDDKAIIISASKNSLSNGARYPNVGTAMLLSMVQLFQEIKYKYDWKPLRNIYFISFGGSEFNYAGSTELLEQHISSLKEEVFAFVDITQLALTEKDNINLNFESHPFFHKFLRNEMTSSRENIQTEVDIVSHYGDWTPFMANGIPVCVVSSPEIQSRTLPTESNKDDFASLDDTLKKAKAQENLKITLIYLFELVLKLVDDPILPLDINGYVDFIDQQMQILEQNYKGKFNYNSIINGLLRWRKLGNEWEFWKKSWDNIVMIHEDGVEPSLLSMNRWTWNRKLMNIGRRTCSSLGLPERPFYKNVVFGPTMFTKEHVATPEYWALPAIKDALFQNNLNSAQVQLDILGKILEQTALIFAEEATDSRI